MNLVDWQQRVVDEKKDLDQRREKLTLFIHMPNPAYAALLPEDQALLIRQKKEMDQLSATLGERVARFK